MREEQAGLTNCEPYALAATAGEGLASPRDYFELLKPRVMSLCHLHGSGRVVRAPGPLPILAFTALLCIAVGAGAAGALNMWWDADIDAVMSRARQAAGCRLDACRPRRSPLALPCRHSRWWSWVCW